jgi:EmrB/QacA subfamily drug resistance transporter
MTVTKYIVFGVTSLSFLLVAISGTTVSVAFPIITSSFNVSLILAGWVLSVNQLAATAIMPLAGKAGDIFGGKLTFLISIAVFTIGSLLGAIAPNIEFLIAARFIQAIGLGSFLPLGTAIVSDQFPDARQQAIGLFTSIMPIGMIIGPNIGGWLVDAFGWRSVFWLNIPLGVIVFIASFFLLKPGKKEEGQLDLAGAGLFTGSLSALLIALSDIGSNPSRSSWLLPGLLFAVAIVLMLIFIRREGRIENPIIDLQLLKKRPFLAANIFNLLYGASVLGIMSFTPLYATSLYGMSTLESGLILTPRSVGTMAASIVTSISLPKWGYRWPMLFGTGIMVLSLFLLGIELTGINVLGIHLSGTMILLTIMFLSGVGMGVTAPAANNACIELMPNRIATITGVRGMFRQSGSAISIAVTSLILQNFSGMNQGFTVVYFGLAAILVISAPLVFAMPKAAGALYPTEKASRQMP